MSQFTAGGLQGRADVPRGSGRREIARSSRPASSPNPDPTAMADLKRSYQDWGAELWRAVFAFSGGDAAITDDAVAEAFAQAARLGNGIRNLKAWTYSVAFRYATSELRRAKRFESLDPQIQVAAPDPSSTGVQEILEHLGKLTLAQRKAFLLRDVFGFSNREAAVLLGTSDVSIRVHVHAARKRLRGVIDESES